MIVRYQSYIRRFLAVVAPVSSLAYRTITNAKICITFTWIITVIIVSPVWLAHSLNHLETRKEFSVHPIIIATLGSSLGISTLLEILLSCKLDHEAKWHDYMQQEPSTHRPSWESDFHVIQEAEIWWVSSSCVVGVKNVSGRCLAGVCKEWVVIWKVERKCLISV